MSEATDTAKPSDFLPLVGLILRNWGKVTAFLFCVGSAVGGAYWNYLALAEEKAALQKEVEILTRETERNNKRCDFLSRQVKRTHDVLGLKQPDVNDNDKDEKPNWE